MRKGKITLNFKERKLELLHTAKKTVKEMKNLQVIELTVLLIICI